MKDGERLSLEQIRAFLAGSEEVGFKAANQRQLYEWIARTLCARQYPTLGRSGKGLVRQYLAKVTGLSRAQVTRLIGKDAESGTVQVRRMVHLRHANRATLGSYTVEATTAQF